MKTLDAVVLDEAIRAVRERNIATLDYAIVVGIETYLRATNPPPMTDNPQPAVLVDAREAIAALTPAPTEAGGVSVYRENLLEAWSALRMIREAIETLGPVGALMSEEAVNAFIAPAFSGEAEALIAGIQKIAALSSTPAADAGWDRDAAFIKWWCAQPRDDAFQQKDWFAQRAFNAGIETALNPEARDER